MNLHELTTARCTSRKGEKALDMSLAAELLANLPQGWKLAADGRSMSKDFRFQDFHHTLGFINAVGFMANHEDHHPDLEAGYGHCKLSWSTHDVDGLSLNDFICAAKVEALLAR